MDILLSNRFDDAIVAYIVKKWSGISDVPLGRTIIQKLCYFVKSKGVPLDYDFDMYHYGPYSQNLYFRMDDMIADGVVIDEKALNTVNSNIKTRTSSSRYLPGANVDKLLNMYNEDLSKITATIDNVVNAFHKRF